MRKTLISFASDLPRRPSASPTADNGNGSSEREPLIQPTGAEDAIAAAEYGTVIHRQNGGATNANGNADGKFNGGPPSPEPTTDDLKAAPDSRPSPALIIPALSLGIFLAALDTTLLLSSQTAIGSSLNALHRTSFLATAYILTTTAFQPLYGKLSDIFGRRNALLFAYAVFAVGCAACGSATSMDGLIAARALAGVGGGGMTTVASILVSDLVGLRQRGTYQGILNVIFASGASAGAPLGGWLVESVGWRWGFWGQVPIAAAAFCAVAMGLRGHAVAGGKAGGEGETLGARIKRVDFLGALVLLPAVLSLLLALDSAGNTSFSAPSTISLFASSALFFSLFTLSQTHLSPEPFAPPRVLCRRPILAACTVNLLSCAAHMSTTFFLPIYLQLVAGLSAAQAGTALLPLILAGVTGSLLGGAVMQRTGRTYVLTVASYAVQAGGFVLILLSTGLLASSLPLLQTGMALIGLGNGIGITSTLVSIIGVAGPDDQAVATAGSYLFRSLGLASGAGIAGGIVQSRVRAVLAARLLAGGMPLEKVGELVDAIRRSAGAVEGLPDWVVDAVGRTYEESVRGAWGVSIGLAVATVVVAGLIGEVELR